MGMDDLDWSCWRSFLAVMRTGSLSGAARELRLSQPTLGRHVNAIERAVGAPLFTRSPGGLRATATARALVPQAEAMALAADNLIRIASGEREDASGIVRLTASDIVGTFVLPDMLAGFRREHPAIALELVLSDRNDDLLRGEADIAVRMIRPVQSALLARRIGTLRIGLYAHRDYLSARGLPANPQDLARHDLIGFDRAVADSDLPEFDGFRPTRENFHFRCDNSVAQLAAVRAGLGIGVCHEIIARGLPELQPVLASAVTFPLEVWLVMHEDLKASRRIRLVYDHLVLALSSYLRAP